MRVPRRVPAMFLYVQCALWGWSTLVANGFLDRLRDTHTLGLTKPLADPHYHTDLTAHRHVEISVCNEMVPPTVLNLAERQTYKTRCGKGTTPGLAGY